MWFLLTVVHYILITCDQYESKLVPPSEDDNIFMASGTFERGEQFKKK